MNIQTLIIGILACILLFLTFLIVDVIFVGILRIVIISVFEFDFVKAYKEMKELKKHKSEVDDGKDVE